METSEMNAPNVLKGECHLNQGDTTGQKETNDGSKEGTNDTFGNNNGFNHQATDGDRELPRKKVGKQSYASLFKDNRAPVEASLLKFIEPPIGEVVIGSEEIDTVEKAFGYCLVGYVMGPRPSAFNVLNFTKRWGGNVKFQFKENGWIKFQFDNEGQRDSVLNGGPYLISGKQLFLKKLPSCFLFGKEDMVYLPSWVQIYGLPADCWTVPALSRIASVVGKPIHTDQLTISKKGSTYARVLVEIDAKKSRVWECSVMLPTGKPTIVKFKYELDPKYCNTCNSLGHITEMCGADMRKNNNAQHRKQIVTNKNRGPTDDKYAGDNTFMDTNAKQQDIPESSNAKATQSPMEDARDQQNTTHVLSSENQSLASEGVGQIPVKKNQEQQTSSSFEMNIHTGMVNTTTVQPPGVQNTDTHVPTGVDTTYKSGKNTAPDPHNSGQPHFNDFGDDDLLSDDGTEWPTYREDDYEFDGEESVDTLSCVRIQDKEEWKTVAKKNRRTKFKVKNIPHKSNAGIGSSSMETEYVEIDPTTNRPIKGVQTRVFRKKDNEARRPYTAFGGL